MSIYRCDGRNGNGWEEWEWMGVMGEMGELEEAIKNPGGDAVRIIIYIYWKVGFTRGIWLRLLPARGGC